MSTQQKIENLISNAPENKLDIILAFVQFVLLDNSEINNSLLSEPSLAKDWLLKEEDNAWQHL
ncbi:MAG: hypothetical protein OSJ45_11205 [Lachnospiraceae bacterium]|nr:hypothetical protein [Lachnospiraceae bacterium]